MIELLNNYWQTISPYIPLGFIGIYRWSIWIIKKVVSKKYRPINKIGHSDTLSIVVPVYNENIDVFQMALESWKNNNPDEIIAVIDYTDKACIEKFQEFQKEYQNSKLIITHKSGKRGALADGIKASQYNIIALVDSDTIWDPNIKEVLLAPFANPLVGGVGPRQDVLNTNTIARRLFNIHLDQRYFDEMTYLATVGDALTCISGRTALYRKEAVIYLCEDLENETFWGVKCVSGDDKCLTRLIQEKGWKVRYQGNVRVLTPGASDLITLFKQHLRWTRNSYRSDLKSLMSKWIWKREKLLAFHMIDSKTQPFTLIMGPIYFIFSIIWGHWLIAGILLTWWHISRGIKLYSHLRHRPSDILLLPFYIFTTYLMAILKIYAMVTIGKQGWITRWDKGRLQVRVSNIFRLFKLSASYLATFSVIFLLSFGVLKYKSITTVYSYNNSANYSDIKSIEIKNTIVDKCQQVILNNSENQQFAYYIIEKNDTLSFIAQKYNVRLSVITENNKEAFKNPNYILIGEKLKIPILELQNISSVNELTSIQDPEIIFDKLSNTIYVDGRGSVVTLSNIYKTLNSESIIEKISNKEWILRSNLLIRKGVTLLIDDNDVSWLKLKSNKDGFIWIQSNNGSIVIRNTKITSWVEESQLPDEDYEDGRSFILAVKNGRMDIINSELSFLGYDDGLKSGVAWQGISDNSNNYLFTGQVLQSKFYNNYSGIYLSGTTSMKVINNSIAHNGRYGIYIRNGTNGFIIKDNFLNNNGDVDYYCS